LYNQSD
jgi:hypothetical protein